MREGIRPQGYVRGLREEGDAFLLIGNEALRSLNCPPAGFDHRYDLAKEMVALETTPFRFRTLGYQTIDTRRTKARVSGALGTLAGQGHGTDRRDSKVEFAGELGSAEALASYLRNFHYRLGPEEKRGLEEFRRLVQENRILEPVATDGGSA